MEQNLHETNKYDDTLFPIGMYQITRDNCIPKGRGYRNLHWHEELQYVLVLSGNVIFQVNGCDYPLGHGEALFINKGALHMSSEMTIGAKYVSFNFSEQLLCFFPDSRMEYKFVKTYISNEALPAFKITTSVHNGMEIINYLQKLKLIYEDNTSSLREYDISLLITAIWRHLLVCLEKHDYIQNKKQIALVERTQVMLTFIRQNYTKQISLTDIAKSAMVSNAECNRCFRNMLHITPYEYLIQYRLKVALELLSFSEWNITEISQKIGYNNVTHFIQTFRRKYGISPKQYRITKHNEEQY